MTRLLQEAFQEASKLSDAEQDLLARRLLEEVAAEDAFDRKIADTAPKLAKLADEALREHRTGKTSSLDPETL